MPARAAVLVLSIAAALPVRAQEADATTVPWAYSNYFGTGWYHLGDDSDTFVLRYVYRKRQRDAGIDEDGRRVPGLQWRFPVTLGFEQFPLDDIAGSVDPGNFASLSVMPGLWVDLPLSERWQLRPFAAAGWGTLLDGEDSAWTWWGGVHSQFLLTDGALRTALINSISYVGYSPQSGPSDGFLPMLSAVEFGHPLMALADGDDELRLVWHAAFTHFHGKLELTRPSGRVEDIAEQWEAGLAVRRREGRLDFGWFELDRLGLAYRFSGDGDFEGVGLVLHSLFDQ